MRLAVRRIIHSLNYGTVVTPLGVDVVSICCGGRGDIPRRESTAKAGPWLTYDPDRAAAEAGRRARSKIRRYCASNRLGVVLGTLTYAGEGCFDPLELRKDVGGFFKQLRARLGFSGSRIPYVWVPEWHAGGHGLHVHFAVGRFIRRSLIEEAWGHGYVHIKLLGNLPAGSGNLGEARLAARYLAKYAAKSLSDDRPAGSHRYEVAQGFQPAALHCYGATIDDAIHHASRYMGARPRSLWLSSTQEDWHGPPACWVAW